MRGAGVVVHDLPLGAIVATCTLVGVVATDIVRFEREPLIRNLRTGTSDGVIRNLWADEAERTYGDFVSGRYAWLLADVVTVNPPVPFKGGQGLSRTWTP